MKQHGFDSISFVSGALVLTLGIIFAWGVHGASWIPPVLLIGVGVAFVAAAAQRVLAHESDE